MIFRTDKNVAAFTGRPSLLRSKFTTTPLPLDVSDEELLSSKGQSLAESPNIDKYGWNNHNHIYSVTVHRARMMLALVKEEILEIALEPAPGSNKQSLLYVIQ